MPSITREIFAIAVLALLEVTNCQQFNPFFSPQGFIFPQLNQPFQSNFISQPPQSRQNFFYFPTDEPQTNRFPQRPPTRPPITFTQRTTFRRTQSPLTTKEPWNGRVRISQKSKKQNKFEENV